LTAYVREQVDPVDKLHREIPAPLLLDELSQADEVRVAKVAHGAELALDSRDLVSAERAQRFDRHASVAFEVDRFEHRPLRPPPELPYDAESFESGDLGGGKRMGLHEKLRRSGDYRGRTRSVTRRNRPGGLASRNATAVHSWPS
jgi:hypothetical protein